VDWLLVAGLINDTVEGSAILQVMTGEAGDRVSERGHAVPPAERQLPVVTHLASLSAGPCGGCGRLVTPLQSPIEIGRRTS